MPGGLVRPGGSRLPGPPARVVERSAGRAHAWAIRAVARRDAAEQEADRGTAQGAGRQAGGGLTALPACAAVQEPGGRPAGLPQASQTRWAARPVFVPEAPDTYDTLVRADTVIVPAVRDVHEEAPPDLVEAVKLAHANGARVASLCSGAFVLAAAGLLEGRKATTHWLYTDELARRFPAVDVDPDVLYIDNGDVLTSAGTTAAIDLCLAMVAADHGADLASTLARRLVAPPHRSGGQAQYVEAPAPQTLYNGLGPLVDWMRQHLAEPLTVAAIARHVGVAERTLIRHFNATIGTTPIKWLTAQRVLHARRLLETTDLSVEQVAESFRL